jgi:trehalose 2-sulfotransferase
VSSDYFDQAERETRTREWGLPTDDLTAYVRAMRSAATTPNGVLGSKMMWNDFDWLRSSFRPVSGTDAGLRFMRTTFPDAQYVWLRRADMVRQGISWWRAAVTDQWALRTEQQAGQPAPDVEGIVPLVRFAEQCEEGWRRWFASTGIQPCQVVYEDLARDRLAVANRVLGFLRLPRLDAGDLPPVRYRKQADAATERYVDLVRSAMLSG